MSPELVTGLTNPFFANGIVGAICVALALYILKQIAEARSERAAHKVELASKDALIKELYDARIAEARVGYDIAKSNEKTMDAFLIAVNGRAPK